MESKYDKANPVSNDESENSSFFVKANCYYLYSAQAIRFTRRGYQCSNSRIYKV